MPPCFCRVPRDHQVYQAGSDRRTADQKREEAEGGRQEEGKGKPGG